MSLAELLENSLGKSINQICQNNFHHSGLNHCAHFVSHILEMDFSFNCRDFHGGNNKSANVRVHEVFPRCPRVGKFEDRPADRPVLVFVTRRDVVDLINKRMQNIPEKHIGILSNGRVYHYSNSNDKVVKWTPTEFITRFEAAYSGTQGLFFGTFPGSDLILDVDTSGATVTQGIAFELKTDDGKWSARAAATNDPDWFYVGRETKDDRKKYYGIYQKTNEYYGPKFDAADYVDTLGHWAYLLHATAYCESKNFFNLPNTYDRAKFTFGFYQLAAHTPKDNLILLFRRLTELEQSGQYFPELKMIDGKLHRVKQDGSSTNLEEAMPTGPRNASQLQLFMNYLNPNRKPIEEQEVLQIARLMHWTVNDPAFRQLQVAVSINILQRKMSQIYNGWYQLHGKSDTLCTLIADIHHQGRASRVKVAAALGSRQPEDALIDINPTYAGRATALREIIGELKADGKLGQKKYDAMGNEFV